MAQPQRRWEPLHSEGDILAVSFVAADAIQCRTVRIGPIQLSTPFCQAYGPRAAARQPGIGQGFQTQPLDALQFGLEHQHVGVFFHGLVSEDGTIFL